MKENLQATFTKTLLARCTYGHSTLQEDRQVSSSTFQQVRSLHVTEL